MTVKLDPELEKQDRFANSSGSEYYYIPLRANRQKEKQHFGCIKLHQHISFISEKLDENLFFGHKYPIYLKYHRN